MTSFDVVAYLRRLLKAKKVGHCGTLDPSAVGVLPVCVGRSTGISEYIAGARKSYRAELLFGLRTDTLDLDGAPVGGAKLDGAQARGEAADAARPGAMPEPQAWARLEMPGREAMENTLRLFLGRQRQTPPMYSAVKSGGVRLHVLARKGIEVCREPREIEIFGIRLVWFAGGRYVIDVDCSKGTYVRVLCQDIGERLNLPACLSFLIRKSAAGLHIKDSLTLETIERLHCAGKLREFLIPPDAMLEGYPAAVLDERLYARYANGAAVELDGHGGVAPGLVRAYFGAKFVGLGELLASKEGRRELKSRKFLIERDSDSDADS
jgi:tRNA pseudouridine55 synthase